jgi:hypothetical protein
LCAVRRSQRPQLDGLCDPSRYLLRLPERSDLERRATCLQALPILLQFSLVKFSPCLDETALPLGKMTTNQFYGIDSENPGDILVVGVKMRSVVRLSRLSKHPNDNSEEATDLWQQPNPVR